MKKNALVSPSFLKQQARKLKKEKSFTQSHALDEASKQLGYSNYKNYLNLLNAKSLNAKNLKAQPASLEQLEILRLQKQELVNEKLIEIASQFHGFKESVQSLIDKQSISGESADILMSLPENTIAVEKYIGSYFLKTFLEDEEGEVNDFSPYHFPKSVSLDNLNYKVEDGKLFAEGDYSLALQFAFEYDKEDTSDFFDDELMFGWFDLQIRADGEIDLADLTIGHS